MSRSPNDSNNQSTTNKTVIQKPVNQTISQKQINQTPIKINQLELGYITSALGYVKADYDSVSALV